MPRRFRSFRVRSRAARRKTVWSHESQTMANATTRQSIDLLSDFRTTLGLSANPLGITIRRIRITIQIDFDFTSAGLTELAGAYLSCYRDTVGLATAATLGPTTEPDKDYSFRQWLPLTGALGSVHEFTGTRVIISREYDSKSSRVLRDIGDTYYFVMSPTGGVSAGAQLETSTLLLLP